MNSKAMSLKGRIKNYAKSNNIAAQVVLQNYMFERFLERLSLSEYSEKFVVKGGMLVAVIVGLGPLQALEFLKKNADKFTPMKRMEIKFKIVEKSVFQLPVFLQIFIDDTPILTYSENGRHYYG